MLGSLSILLFLGILLKIGYLMIFYDFMLSRTSVSRIHVPRIEPLDIFLIDTTEFGKSKLMELMH